MDRSVTLIVHVCAIPPAPTREDRGRTWFCPTCKGAWVPAYTFGPGWWQVKDGSFEAV